MFFEISSLKNFAIFTGIYLCWGLFLIKLQAFRPSTFLKRNSNTGVSCGYCKIFKNSLFHRAPPAVASGNPTTVLLYYYSLLGCLLFDFPPPHAFEFDQKLTQNVAQMILYCHVALQFLPCLNRFITCFWFQNIFWKNISGLRFWWKTYTKRCTNNYVISSVKRFS